MSDETTKIDPPVKVWVGAPIPQPEDGKTLYFRCPWCLNDEFYDGITNSLPSRGFGCRHLNTSASVIHGPIKQGGYHHDGICTRIPEGVYGVVMDIVAEAHRKNTVQYPHPDLLGFLAPESDSAYLYTCLGEHPEVQNQLREYRECEGWHHGSGSPECPRALHHHHDEGCKSSLRGIVMKESDRRYY